MRSKLKSADKVPLYAKIIFFTLIAVLTLTIMFPVRRSVNRQILQYKKQVIEFLEEKLDHKITYEAISPSFLHAFEIRGLKISSYDNPGDYLFDIDRVRLRFNIFRYERSNPLNAFIGLTIVNSDFIYEPSKNEAVRKLFDSAGGSTESSPGEFSLPDIFTIKGKNLAVTFKNDDLEINLSSLFFTLGTSEQGDLTVTAKTDTGFSLFGLPAPSPVADLEINTGMSVTGRLSPDLSWADIDINSRNFNSNVFSIERIKWNLKYISPGHFVLTKTGDNIPADISLTADIPENNLQINLQAQDFIFTEYFEEAEVLKKYHLVLQSVVSGTAEADFRFNTGDFLYDGDLLIEDITGILPLSFDASADFSGVNSRITFHDSLIESIIGKLAYQGSLELTDNLPALNGRLHIYNLVSNNYRIGASLGIYTDSEGNYTIDAESASINDLLLRQISAEILPYGDSLDYKLSGGVLNKDESISFIESEGNIQISDDFFIQATVDTEDLPVDPVLSLLPIDFSLPAAVGNLKLTTSFFLSGSLSEMAFASPLIKLEDKESNDKSLSFALSGNNSGFRINSIALDWLGNSLTGKISADLTEDNDLIMSSQFIYNNISLEPSGVFDSEGNLSLIGDYGLKINLIKNYGSGYNFSLNLESFPFLIDKDFPSYLNIDAMAIYDSIDDWKILINNFSMSDLPVASGTGNIETALLLSPSGGSIYKMSYRDSFSELNGQGSILIDEFSSSPTGRLQLSVGGGSTSGEFYNLRMRLDKDEADGELTFNNLPVSRLSESLPASGFIKGKLSLSGKLSNPEIDLSVSSNGMIYNNEALNFNAALSYHDLNLNIEDISGDSGGISFNGINGELDLLDGEHFLYGSTAFDSKYLKIESDFQANAKTASISSTGDMSNIYSEDFTADFDLTKLVVNNEEDELWGIRIRKQNSIITAKGGPENSISGNLYDDGYFTLNASAPFPLTMTVSGTISSGTVDAEIKEISYMFDNLDIPFLYFFEGNVTGNLRVKGNINDPDLFGQINLSNIIMNTSMTPDKTDLFNTSFFFREKTITMPATRIPMGNGMLVLTVDSIIDRWLPRNYSIELRAPENQGISMRYYHPPYFLEGFAEGYMRVFGDFTTMRIDGDIKILDSEILIDTSQKKGPSRRPTEHFVTDLKITTGENNQFFWPSLEVPILKGFLSTDKGLTMHYSSALSKFTLDGELGLNGGEILYFEKNFYIKEGGLEFTKSGSGSIDPFLSTKAEIRDVNSEGELTRIYLIVDRSPLSNFAPRFESEPTLSTAEILSIIGGNFTDSLSSSGAFDAADALLTGLDLFTEFTIFNSIEDGLKSITGLDLLSIRSSFLSNILDDKIINVSGTSGLASFVKYLDNTTLYLGKYVTDDIFIQGLFQFDLYNNSGYSDGLHLDSEIKLEWESPIANIELNFYPDFYDPVEGLNKTSVGLSWRFSY